MAIPRLSLALKRQSGTLPGVKTTLNNEGFAGAPYFLREPRRIGHRSRAALAMKDDRLAVVQRKLSLLKPGQRQMVRPADFLPGMLIRLADVDQDCALTQKTLGFALGRFLEVT